MTQGNITFSVQKLEANVVSAGWGLTLGFKGTLWRMVQLRTLHCVVFFSFLWRIPVVKLSWLCDPCGKGTSLGDPLSVLGLILSFSVIIFFFELVKTLVTFFKEKKWNFSLKKADL